MKKRKYLCFILMAALSCAGCGALSEENAGKLDQIRQESAGMPENEALWPDTGEEISGMVSVKGVDDSNGSLEDAADVPGIQEESIPDKQDNDLQVQPEGKQNDGMQVQPEGEQNNGIWMQSEEENDGMPGTLEELDEERVRVPDSRTPEEIWESISRNVTKWYPTLSEEEHAQMVEDIYREKYVPPAQQVRETPKPVCFEMVTLSEEEKERIDQVIRQYYERMGREVVDYMQLDPASLKVRGFLEADIFAEYDNDEIVFFSIAFEDEQWIRSIVIGSKDAWNECSILSEGY